jgi:hypothetical protein
MPNNSRRSYLIFIKIAANGDQKQPSHTTTNHFFIGVISNIRTVSILKIT